jgi:death-on-curing protein
VLCSRLIRNHPLPDGNKRVGYLCLVEFVERSGHVWSPRADDDPDGSDTVAVLEGVASRQIGEPALARWIEERIA